MQAQSARRSLGGFFLTGLLLAFLGSILPAWGYHLKSEFLTVGNFFLSMNVGLLASFKAGSYLLSRRGIRFTLILSSALACAGFLYLARIPPTAVPWWRCSGLGLLGLSVGMMNMAVFHAITPLYERDKAATLNLAGGFFGLGSLLTTVLVAGSFYVYTVPSILVLLAVIPGFFAINFAKYRFEPAPLPHQPSLREAFRDFKSPGAILLSLLLVFQFGNEWSIAGWLPIFLVQRLGISPASSLHLLSLYWLSLLVGRIAMQALLPRARHSRVLFASSSSAVLGCTILSFTNNRFGAVSGILLIGAGFAAIYPLLAELIGSRFPYYHPGFFNGIFSIAAIGGLLAPWTLGIYANLWGIRVVMLLPLLGACVVLVLAVLIWVYVKLTTTPDTRGAAA
jgi:fucose permease